MKNLINNNMHLYELHGIEPMTAEEHANVKTKAGMIPYFYDNGVLKMLFAVSSNPAFGGTQPMIAKGHIEEGEDPRTGGIREAEEELGLKPDNFANKPFFVTVQKIAGNIATYDLHIFAVEVRDPKDFNPHDAEIASVHWLTIEQYQKYGRKSQFGLVQALVNKLS